MKRLLCITLLLTCALAAALVAPRAARAETSEEKALTLMIYMCGSNLESQYGSATADILEMMQSGVDTDKVNVLLLTGGSEAWQIGLDAATTEISLLFRGQLRSLLRESAMNMGDPATLTQLLTLGVEQFPARQYALLLWDHGAGPLEGICLDELNTPDRLSIQELTQAISDANLPDRLSWIGFDACLMSTAEVAQAMAPYACYMIASQETEPAAGWDYAFLNGIENDADGAATGRRIVDGYFAGENEGASKLTLSCLDLSQIDGVSEAMDAFFDPISRGMDAELFASLSELRMSTVSFGKVVRGITSGGYDLVDLGSLVAHCAEEGDDTPVLQALDDAVVYSRSSDEDASGLSVYHPLRNKEGYLEGWKDSYASLGFSPGYQRYLDAFGALLTGDLLADWSGLRLELIEDALQSLFRLQLTPQQLENAASAQLIVLGVMQDDFYSNYAAQLSENGAPVQKQSMYYPIDASEVSLEDGQLTAAYSGRSLYMLDAEGNIAAGPISYALSDDGSFLYIKVSYHDDSGRENPAPSVNVLYTCAVNESTDEVRIVDAEVYDRLTGTYTRRIAFDESVYTNMGFSSDNRLLPEDDDLLPGVTDWESTGGVIQMFAIPRNWRLCFFEDQLSGIPLYATLQITDKQQNTHCTPVVRVHNPNLHNVKLSPQVFTGEEFEIEMYMVLDTSPLKPGLLIGMQYTNTSDRALAIEIPVMYANGYRAIDFNNGLYASVSGIEPGETQYEIYRLTPSCLAGLGELTDLFFRVRWGAKGEHDWDSAPFRCQVSGCDVSSFSPLIENTLAEVREEGMTWRLVSLQKNRTGGLDGLLHITCDAEQEKYVYGSFIVNDSVQTDDKIGVTLRPNTDMCIPFTITNRIDSSYNLHVTDVDSRVYLGFDHLLERFGVPEIRSLSFSWIYGRSEPLRFELDQSVPFASAEEIAEWSGEEARDPRPLLEGELTVEVERLLVADDGIALQLSLQNHSDRDITLEIGHKAVNGIYSYYQIDDDVSIAAGTCAVACIEVLLDEGQVQEVGDVSELSLTFRIDDYTMPPARICLNTSQALGQSGGAYLSRADFITVPSPHPPLENAAVIPDPADIPYGRVSASMHAENQNYFESYAETALSDRLVLTLQVENLSDETMEYVFDDFVLNGVPIDSGFLWVKELAPGDTVEDDITIYLEGAIDLYSLETIEFTLSSKPGDDYHRREETTILLQVE